MATLQHTSKFTYLLTYLLAYLFIYFLTWALVSRMHKSHMAFIIASLGTNTNVNGHFGRN